jgi:hypothetical protein
MLHNDYKIYKKRKMNYLTESEYMTRNLKKYSVSVKDNRTTISKLIFMNSMKLICTYFFIKMIKTVNDIVLIIHEITEIGYQFKIALSQLSKNAKFNENPK